MTLELGTIVRVRGHGVGTIFSKTKRTYLLAETYDVRLHDCGHCSNWCLHCILRNVNEASLVVEQPAREPERINKPELVKG